MAKLPSTLYSPYSRVDGINLEWTKNNKTFHKLIENKFTTKVPTFNKEKKANNPLPAKLVNFLKLPPPQLLPRLLKEVLEKSKFHEKNILGKNRKVTETTKLSYTQILFKNINNILKIKKNFPELLNKKIEELNKLIYNN